MKKTFGILIVLFIVALTGIVTAAVSEKWASLMSTRRQYNDVAEAKMLIETAVSIMAQTKTDLDEIASNGSFDNVDAEILTPLNQARTLINQFNSAVANNDNLTTLLSE